MKQELKQIKKVVRKYWGKKCNKFSIGCPTCQIWQAIDVLEQADKIGGDLKTNK